MEAKNASFSLSFKIPYEFIRHLIEIFFNFKFAL